VSTRIPQIVCFLSLVAAIAAGCGGGSKSSQETPAPASSPQSSSQGSSSATAWAASFCGYAKTWQTSLRQAGATLKTSNSSTATASAVNKAKSANITFQQQLSRLGPPSGASQQVTQQLRSYAGRLKSTNQSLQGLLSETSSSASESATKIKEAKSMVQVMAGQLQQAYTYMANLNVDPQLKQELKTNPTCRTVFGKA
jgi:hypothetical protein